MGGVETSRGIAYQNAQAVLTALKVLSDDDLSYMRVEGTDDILDIEVFGTSGALVLGQQIKTRNPDKTWGKTPIITALERWLALGIGQAAFEFVTDGRLGPTAVELHDALKEAARGSADPIARFISIAPEDPRLAILARARVREDTSGVEAVLMIAENEVKSLMAGARSRVDLNRQAKSAVDALLREIASRSGETDPNVRVLHKHDIQEILGGVRGIRPGDRWVAGAKDEYLRVARESIPDLVSLDLNDDDAPEDSVRLPVEDLLAADGASILSGHTGEGKSSVSRLAVHAGAMAGCIVICAQAEAYVDAQLPSLVADALSQALGRVLPTITGEQALADPDVVLIIDGASEIPHHAQRSLGIDLRPLILSQANARVVLVGRDRAVMSSLIPTSTVAQKFTVAPLTHEQQQALVTHAHRVDDQSFKVGDRPGSAPDGSLLRLVNDRLRDADRNPMLFNMAVSLAVTGHEEDLETHARLYAATIRQNAERARITDVDQTASALGIVFAGLLDEGRRFVYPFEYRRRLSDAARRLDGAYFGICEEHIAENVGRSGLLVPHGSDQLLVPLHDSYADYLAGLAHARGLAPFPPVLDMGDERRIEFAVQIGGLSGALAAQVSRDLPFHTVRLAEHDERSWDESAPTRIYDVLSNLLPLGDLRVPVLCSTSGCVVATLLDCSEPRWVNPEELRASSAPRIVVDQGESQTGAAVRLWRLALLEHLRPSRSLSAPTPRSASEAAELLRAHFGERRRHFLELVEVALPVIARERILTHFGPVGADVTISPRADGFAGFPLNWLPAENIEVKVENQSEDAEHGHASGTRHVLDQSPAADAAAALRTTIEKLTETAWLK